MIFYFNNFTNKVEDQEEKNKYSAAFLDFFKDLPEAAVAATAESFANIGNNAVQLAGAGSNLLFRGRSVARFLQASSKITRCFSTINVKNLLRLSPRENK